MYLGSTIKRCRIAQTLTLDDLAIEAGLSKGYLSLVESGQREPSLSAINAIANALNIPIEILVLMAARSDQLDELDSKNVKKLQKAVWKLVDQHGT